MPTDRHLEYVETTDFAPGLWSAGGTLLMPAQGWQTMTDCRPEPGGGLRAAMKGVAWNLTGITNQSTSSVLALVQYGGQGTGGAPERYLFLKETSTQQVRVWFDSGGASWSLIKTHSYAANPNSLYIQTDTFLKSTGVNYLLYIIWQNGGNSGVEGLWEINRTAHTSASVDVTFTPTSLCVMDDVVVVATGHTLYFSTSGTTALDHTARFLTVQGSRWEGLISGLIYIAPSDLLVATNSTVWSLVQGSLASNPTVRSMSDAHIVAPLQDLNLGEQGIAFIEPSRGLYTTADGNNFNYLSEQLAANSFVGGDICQVGAQMIAPSGYAFDLRSHSWYTLSVLNSSASVGYRDQRDDLIIYATGGTSPTIYEFDPGEVSRVSSFTAKTSPLRAQDGRRIKIRSVQIPCVTYHSGDTVAATVNGVTKTFTATGAGRNIIPFLFKEEAEYLDVTITSTANSGSNEAPTIEALRIGKATSHRSL